MLMWCSSLANSCVGSPSILTFSDGWSFDASDELDLPAPLAGFEAFGTNSTGVFNGEACLVSGRTRRG